MKRMTPGQPTAFACDAHLGGLARYLRMLGFDAWFDPAYADAELVAIGRTDHRLVLSKDRQLLAELGPARSYRVLAAKPQPQLLEVMTSLGLGAGPAPLSRCLLCNTVLVPVTAAETAGLVPEAVRSSGAGLLGCRQCGRFFWWGSHARQMLDFVSELGRRLSGLPAPHRLPAAPPSPASS